MLLLLPPVLPLSTDAPGVVTAGLRWLDCDVKPVLPVEAAGLPTLACPRLEVPFTADPVLRTAVFSFLRDGVVLTTEDLLADEPADETAVLPETLVRDEVLPEACALPTLLLFLLTELLVPMPPLSEVPLLKTRSEPV